MVHILEFCAENDNEISCLIDKLARPGLFRRWVIMSKPEEYKI